MKCQFKKQTGEQCGAWAVKDSHFCFAHNPDLLEERREANSRGGKVGKDTASVRLENINMEDSKAISELLADTINRVRRANPDGSMDLKVATTIGFLAGKMLEARDKIQLEERLDKLEKMMAE